MLWFSKTVVFRGLEGTNNRGKVKVLGAVQKEGLMKMIQFQV